jgi:predicted nucleic acid-binding protein
MSAVLLDTVGLLARWDKSDQWHDAAQTAYLRLIRERVRMVTTPFVLMECGNAAARKSYRRDVADLREFMEMAGAVIQPTPTDWQEAWAAYRRGDSDEAGIVDHVSFAVMRRLGLRQAFTNDRHFRAAGFELSF